MDFEFERETLMRISKEQFKIIIINCRKKVTSLYSERKYIESETLNKSLQFYLKIYNIRFGKNLTKIIGELNGK